jgi:DNA-binding NtrC family response regulator
LFLDEIGNLPLDAQRLLLLVLESGQVTRLGENTSRPVDVRVVAATNSDLRLAVTAGTFRSDLLARLNPTGSLTVPPLRNRMVDLPALAATFLRRTFTQKAHRDLLEEYAHAQGLPPGLGVELALGRPGESHGFLFTLSTSQVRALRAHAWQGNLHELDHLMGTAAVLTLADALLAAESGRGGRENPRWLPIPAKLISDLLSGTCPRAPAMECPAHPPAATLHGYMSAIEAEILQSLFTESGGDFAAMAKQLLIGPPAKNARRVRLRFNQLGLKAKGRGR